MFPASTKAGGQCMTPGPVDVCKTPTPGGPVPMPYPNMGMPNQASAGTCPTKVKFSGKAPITKDSEIPMSSGDEPGTAGGGVVSNKFKGPIVYKMASMKVKAQGKGVAHIGSMTSHNGSANANMPAGAQIAPSQTKITVGP